MLQGLESRRQYSEQKLKELRDRLASAEGLVLDKACVYVTGSFGRGEACAHSDLDLFIVGRTADDNSKKSLLSNLDDICLKAELIRAVRQMSFPEFSGDGEYLAHYAVAQLIDALGKREDDAINTFTARLLLLLESRSLLGTPAYAEAIDGVIEKYWRDFQTHRDDFVPAFLANDILRLWRTFCVNYEARTQTAPGELLQKRRLKNYKLKHSRLLTCYSALLYLMGIWRVRNTVTPADAREMVNLTPTQRLETLREMPHLHTAIDPLNRVLERYEMFLERTNASEEELLRQVDDRAVRHAMFTAADDFGAAVFEAMAAIGGNSRFHRMLVV